LSLSEVSKWIVEEDEKAALAALDEVLAAGVAPQRIIDEALLSALDRVGELFTQGEYFLADMLQAAHIVQSILAVLKPLLGAGGGERKPKIVLGTVKGDLHDIGKNIVGMFLEGGGFQVIDLGRDVSAQLFIETMRREKPEIVGLSALLTTTMPAMKATVEALKASDALGSTRVVVGGAPITPEFARKIGADGFGRDAVEALKVARALVTGRSSSAS
jgi:5-methyltetrahydrofolate--homocysteine methyltransferase